MLKVCERLSNHRRRHSQCLEELCDEVDLCNMSTNIPPCPPSHPSSLIQAAQVRWLPWIHSLLLNNEHFWQNLHRISAPLYILWSLLFVKICGSWFVSLKQADSPYILFQWANTSNLALFVRILIQNDHFTVWCFSLELMKLSGLAITEYYNIQNRWKGFRWLNQNILFQLSFYFICCWTLPLIITAGQVVHLW